MSSQDNKTILILKIAEEIKNNAEKSMNKNANSILYSFEIMHTVSGSDDYFVNNNMLLLNNDEKVSIADYAETTCSHLEDIINSELNKIYNGLRLKLTKTIEKGSFIENVIGELHFSSGGIDTMFASLAGTPIYIIIAAIIVSYVGVNAYEIRKANQTRIKIAQIKSETEKYLADKQVELRKLENRVTETVVNDMARVGDNIKKEVSLSDFKIEEEFTKNPQEIEQESLSQDDMDNLFENNENMKDEPHGPSM